jgi:hypothetical protein
MIKYKPHKPNKTYEMILKASLPVESWIEYPFGQAVSPKNKDSAAAADVMTVAAVNIDSPEHFCE